MMNMTEISTGLYCLRIDYYKEIGYLDNIIFLFDAPINSDKQVTTPFDLFFSEQIPNMETHISTSR